MPSSVIRRFSHDPRGRRLRIVFTSGEIYDYQAVPSEVVEALRQASSKGRFFGAEIRDRYGFRRVTAG